MKREGFGTMFEKESIVRLILVGLTVPSLVCYVLMVADTNTSKYHPSPTGTASQSPPPPLPPRHHKLDHHDNTGNDNEQQSNSTDRPCTSCGNEFDLVFGGIQVENTEDFWWTDWNEVQRSRRAALNYGCRHVKNARGKSLHKLLTVRKYLYNLLVDDRHKAIYCYVPKVACTNWKRIFMILSGKSNSTDPLSIRSYVPHEEGVLTRLSSFRSRSFVLNEKLKTYTKFLFVRHPIERLVSAYRNKLVINSTSAADFKKRFGVDILRRYRKGDDAHNISKSGDGVTFAEFVSYLIDRRHDSLHSLNEHWALYVDLCYPCSIKYDIIGKYETLEEDSEYILRRIGANPNLHFPPFVTSRTGPLVAGYIASLPDELAEKLHELYKPDFKLFEYEFYN
ncbi:carbohydrate sulfotransferase 11-like [Macrobrachium rosenbergii]|uniref:carbohydrate sulfotransferase 11-like n=1 Tax=Macrobrachium rosenbergii TaxID=79674 RepID=UPI0034D6030F